MYLIQGTGNHKQVLDFKYTFRLYSVQKQGTTRKLYLEYKEADKKYWNYLFYEED